MKHVFLSFLLLVTSQLLGADFDVAPTRASLKVTCSIKMYTRDIEISQGATVYKHPFSLGDLMNMNNIQIGLYVERTLGELSLSDELLSTQKNMMLLLKEDEDHVAAIIEFLHKSTRNPGTISPLNSPKYVY
ncbi:MAG: hypothetical protein NTW22_06035 [Proteobacteria bacterium]|jgi:hypothetical protein|nr:hypothetical protein [Pseudomonadota bacterium]